MFNELFCSHIENHRRNNFFWHVNKCYDRCCTGGAFAGVEGAEAGG